MVKTFFLSLFFGIFAIYFIMGREAAIFGNRVSVQALIYEVYN